MAQMTPAERLVDLLRLHRERGRSFGVAWVIATRTAVAHMPYEERAEWISAFEATWSAWQRAYEGEPPNERDEAVLAIAPGTLPGDTRLHRLPV